MNETLRELAKRERLSFEIARATLSRLVVEAIDAQERAENQRLAEAETLKPLAQSDEQQKKRAHEHRLTCQTCRVRFTATRQHARFCSVACRMRAYRRRRAP